ncbi:GntR family transcriptional regulator [Frigidibacter sp. MR17.14]|uniref:GntR family transcriptional regulator n=1 Tax=Frigidibacter sp. MR17.14 TaxID=3126509 RepID=UPI0030131623
MRGGKAELYEDLKRQILTLERRPDEDLEEGELGTAYGISRTPVRDVLRQLAGEGYLRIRENRGARVNSMNFATMRDFFSVAPLVYDAIARLAVENHRPAQMEALRACQLCFRKAVEDRDHVQMVIKNTLFHSIVGEMAASVYLSPSYSKLLIDHARIGHTFFRPSTPEMEQDLLASCDQHDAMIEALEQQDVGRMVALTDGHWGLCRSNMELFIAPRDRVPARAAGLGSLAPLDETVGD